MSVSVTVDTRAASAMSSGTVYGPPPTRNVDPGTEISTCAEPMPVDCVGTAADGVVAPGASGVVAGGVVVGAGVGGVAAGGLGGAACVGVVGTAVGSGGVVGSGGTPNCACRVRHRRTGLS